MGKALYIAWQAIWGLPQTLAGLAVLAANRSRPRLRFHGAVVTVWDIDAGLSLGPFIFLNAPNGAVDERLLVHEYGHTIQSLILGPLYLLVIGLPSIIWMRTPALVRRRRAHAVSYYSFYPERWANYLGERVLGKPAPR